MFTSFMKLGHFIKPYLDSMLCLFPRIKESMLVSCCPEQYIYPM